MKREDQKFFNDHWKEWFERNSPPDGWRFTDKEWAFLEMPCRGFLGKTFFVLDRLISQCLLRKK